VAPRPGRLQRAGPGCALVAERPPPDAGPGLILGPVEDDGSVNRQSVSQIRATQCVLPRCLSALRYNLTLPLWAALVILWLSWQRRGP
jgi:hypothetical protein